MTPEGMVEVVCPCKWHGQHTVLEEDPCSQRCPMCGGKCAENPNNVLARLSTPPSPREALLAVWAELRLKQERTMTNHATLPPGEWGVLYAAEEAALKRLNEFDTEALRLKGGA